MLDSLPDELGCTYLWLWNTFTGMFFFAESQKGKKRRLCFFSLLGSGFVSKNVLGDNRSVFYPAGFAPGSNIFAEEFLESG
ncbi:MAG TPA: hypothetical protein PKN86_11455, partial [Candidatus Obscuribacter sp.]|nr:hypothetical protein [Candidatus Obscuribacter sp.]